MKRILDSTRYDFNIAEITNGIYSGFGKKKELVEKEFAKRIKNSKFLKFKNAVIFPIFDPFEGLISFSIRNGDFGLPGNKIPKYYMFAFKKNFYLGGLDKALVRIISCDEVFIFEGFYDMLAAYEKGIKNGVFVCGKTLSKMQLALLSVFTRNRVLALDSDEKGLQAMKDIAKEIKLLTGDHCRMVFLDYNLDPAEFLESSKNANFSGRIF